MNTIPEYKLVTASGPLKQKALELLVENDLPTSDIDDSKSLFAVVHNDKVVGTGGLEFFDDCALLRSISIQKDFQGQGWGKFVVDELEKICRERNIDHLFLLTTSAKDFFIKQGYEVLNRNDAPLSIKNTSEFSTVCSSSAILMRKDIS